MTEKLTDDDIILSFFDGYYMTDIGKDSKPYYLCIGRESDEKAKQLKKTIIQSLKLKELMENCTIDLTQRERSLLDLLLEESMK